MVALDREFLEFALPNLITFIEARRELADELMYFTIAGQYHVSYTMKHGFLHELIVYDDFIEYEAARVRMMSNAEFQTGISFN